MEASVVLLALACQSATLYGRSRTRAICACQGSPQCYFFARGKPGICAGPVVLLAPFCPERGIDQ
eukprot:7513196-Pyramimonas_sp.AAC.1